MIQWVHKDNKRVIANCIPSVQEVKRELSVLMRDMKDTNILWHQTSRDKTAMLAKKNTEITINKKTKIIKRTNNLRRN